MDSDPYVAYIIGLILFYTTSTFFSVVKIIFSLTDKNSLPVDNDRLRYFASKIEDILENKVLFSSTVSFGKNIANAGFSILAYCLCTVLLPDYSHLQLIIISLSISVVILSVFAHAIPRAFALYFFQNFLTFAYMLFSFFNFILSVFSKIITGIHNGVLKLLKYDEKFAFLSEEEKLRLADNSDSEEALDEEEKEMIRNIFELGETSVQEIMVPRIDIKGLDINTDYHTVLITIKEAGHSRIPVYKETIDSIVGILYAKDILSWLSNNPGENPEKNWNLEKLLKEPMFIPNIKKLDDLMADLKKNHIHMAIVVDEYGGTDGMVTMEDILEEIVGEIQDEYDTEADPVIQISENIYHIEPHIELDDLTERINVTFNDENIEYNTLSGLFYHEYGDVPKENTEFEFNGLRLKILRMDNQRIEKMECEVLRDNNNPVDIEKSF